MLWSRFVAKRNKAERRRKTKLTTLMQKQDVLAERPTIMAVDTWNGRRRKINSISHGEKL